MPHTREHNLMNPFDITNFPSRNVRPTLLEQALAATNNPDQKIKVMRDAQFGSMVDEDINKNVFFSIKKLCSLKNIE